jgi:diguanylate cyclase (GGDEF)-like protein
VTSQQLLAIVAFAMVANGLLIATALVSMRASRRRGGDHDQELDVAGTHDAMVTMATAGGALGLSAATVTTAAEPIDRVPEHLAGSDATPPSDDPPVDDAAQLGEVMLLDQETGLESPMAWRRAVEDEIARLARYHRPATVMLIELDGLDRLRERLGEAAGARLLVATARTIHAEARAADRCARFGPGRFAILLPETDEIAAINFAERIRADCDRWLEAGEVALRLAIGWVILVPAEGATRAIMEAERRLDAERRQRAGSAA